ncbi:hypothetical protein [Pontibacter liquoris]|uniref:hypothetical protein n=1 Tax=Pontibacter liquoris TaxID=2905677 RepID=UPI001FA6AF1A|nr:hypothetical protein [Pontibacter liquoris]
MNKDKENKNKNSDLTDTSKGDKKDTSNSLARDVVRKDMPAGKTPQNRTDNEEDRQMKNNKK